MNSWMISGPSSTFPKWNSVSLKTIFGAFAAETVGVGAGTMGVAAPGGGAPGPSAASESGRAKTNVKNKNLNIVLPPEFKTGKKSDEV
jgi:hypothetical protein